MENKEFKIHIKSITVFLTHGTDDIHIETDLPSSFPPGVSNDFLTIRFDASCGSGAEYVRKNFGLEPRIINIR